MSSNSSENEKNQMNDLDKLVADTALAGKLVELRKLYKQYPEHFKPYTLLVAVIGNKLEIIKYLLAIGVEWHADCCKYAAELGRFEILVYCIAQGCPFSLPLIAQSLHKFENSHWVIDWDNQDVRILLFQLEAMYHLPSSLTSQIRMQKYMIRCQKICDTFDHVMTGLMLFCFCQFVYYAHMFYNHFVRK